MQVRKSAAWALAIFVCGALLLAPAIWNGFPLLQYDTGGYLARPFEGYLVPSRPAPYGLVLAAAASLDFWPALILQIGATIWILSLTLRALGYRNRLQALAALIAILSLLTSLPFLTAILLTDIFAGLGVLGLHLLLFQSADLSRRERLALMAFVAFCGSTHSATLFLLIGIVVAFGILSLLRVVVAHGLRQASLAALLAFAVMFAANFAVSRRDIWPPGGYGIVFGRMLQDGIVARYLNEHCPDPALRLCPYRNDLPDNADDFLWSDGVFNRLGRFTGLNEEMRSIVLGSLREYPFLQMKLAALAAAKQFVFVGSGEGVLDSVSHTYGIMEHYTPSVVPAMRQARQQHGALDFTAINKVHIPVALLSLAILLALAARALWRGKFDPVERLTLTVTLAFFCNAAICGVFANPHDRYGARLAWIGTLVVALWIARSMTRPDSSREAASAKEPPH